MSIRLIKIGQPIPVGFTGILAVEYDTAIYYAVNGELSIFLGDVYVLAKRTSLEEFYKDRFHFKELWDKYSGKYNDLDEWILSALLGTGPIR